MNEETLTFLSPAWIAALAAAASTATVAPGVDLCIQHVVRDVRYWVRLSHGSVSAGAGRADHADVTFATDEETAWELQSGNLDAQEAFRAGRLRMQGDVARIVADREVLATLADTFAPVRSRTVRSASETTARGNFPK